MKCLNCGGKIPDNAWKCPYCGMSIDDAAQNRKAQDQYLKERFFQIDKAYGFDVDYYKMSTDDLEQFFKKIYYEFEKNESKQNKYDEQFEKILEHISRVDEELQQRYPFRGKNSDLDNDSTLDLLTKYDPPEVYTAAAQIRLKCERQLRDYYHYPYRDKKENDLPPGFKQTYGKMFGEITKSAELANKFWKYHLMLNKFVHSSDYNDIEIKKHYPTIENQVTFLKDVYGYYKKYNLLWNGRNS